MGLFVFAAIAAADPQPLPSSILDSNGVLRPVSVNVPSGNPAYPIKFNWFEGGGFTAIVDGYSTVMWCVDAEETISPPESYWASLVQVSQVTNNANDVRYGNVTYWENNGPPPSSTNYTAQQRYEMAAYLINSYYSPLPNGPNPSNTAQTRSVQTAIWELLWNGAAADRFSYNEISGDGSAPSSYINSAENFITSNPNSSIFDDYAVVTGSVHTNYYWKGVQTYLVQLTSPSPVPEPASVVLLASLLLSILLLTQRVRAKRNRNTGGTQCNASAI